MKFGLWNLYLDIPITPKLTVMNQSNLQKCTFHFLHLFSPLLITIILFFSSCGDSNTSNELKGIDSTKEGTGTRATLAPMTGKLNVLYLENYLDGADRSHAQLEKLIDDFEGRGKDKLILHSLHNSANQLTYGIWQREMAGRRFDYSNVQVLKVSPEEFGDPIDGQEFYFGDQQLGRRDIAILRLFMNNPPAGDDPTSGAKYIIFKPVITPNTGNNNRHLFYELYKSDEITGFQNIFTNPKNKIRLDSAAVESLIKTDPSPPATAN